MVLDDATFEEVVNAQYESLYRFGLSLAGGEAQARDLTQDCFMQLARKAHQIQDRSKLKSWLFTTLYRSFLDDKRRDTRHPQIDMDAAESELPLGLPDAAERIDAATALEALSRLPEPFRSPLVLFYLEEHSYLEIADILGVPAGTVMSRISRGRAMLRKLMEDKPANLLHFEPSKAAVP
jgi:RNA polymerase sigma-70 factor (ECF subfamily)